MFQRPKPAKKFPTVTPKGITSLLRKSDKTSYNKQTTLRRKW